MSYPTSEGASEATTYIDPRTGFTTSTQLAHLQRGTCCGNKCRHCPYGWRNVRTGERRAAVVEISDEEDPGAAVQARLQELKEAQREYELMRLQQQQNGRVNGSAVANDDRDGVAGRKTGGRHGGRLTTKNVPYTR